MQNVCERYLMINSFFLSSRSRHTRCYRDWSSDVCSSDLVEIDHRQGSLLYGCAIAAQIRNGTDLLAQAVIGAHQAIEITRGETQQLAEAERDDIGAARPAVEDRELADKIAGAEPHRGLDPHLDGAGGDEVHAVAALPLAQDGLARQGKPRSQQAAYLGPLARIDIGEHSDARYQVGALQAEIEPRPFLGDAASVAEAAHQIVIDLGADDRFGAQPLILLLFEANRPECQEL